MAETAKSHALKGSTVEHEPIVELQGGDPMPPISTLGADFSSEQPASALCADISSEQPVSALGADFSPEQYAFANAVGNSTANSGSTKRLFLPDVPIVNCERLIADTVPQMGKVNVKGAFAATVFIPASSAFPSSLTLEFNVYDFGDDLTPYCDKRASTQKSQCVVLATAATIRDPALGPAVVRRRLEEHCSSWIDLYMPERSILCMEAIAIAKLDCKPEETELNHQFDCVKNAVVKGQPISLWFLTFMRPGGFNGRGHPILVVMRDPKHVASFALAVPPSAYDVNKQPLHVPLLVMFTTPLHAMSATFSSVNADGVTSDYCESMDAIDVHNWQGMFFDDFMALYDQINSACDIVIFPSLSFAEYTDKVNGLATFDNFPDVVELHRLADVLNGKKLGCAAAEVHMLQSQLISTVLHGNKHMAVVADSDDNSTTSINDIVPLHNETVGALGFGSTAFVASAGSGAVVENGATSINQDVTVGSNVCLLPRELPMLGAVHGDDVTSVHDLIKQECLDNKGMLSFVPEGAMTVTAALHSITKALQNIRVLEVTKSDYSVASYRAHMEATQANMLRFCSVAFPDKPPHMWLPGLEQLRRFLWHPGCSSSTLNPHRTEQFLKSSIDPDVLKAVLQTASEGVDIGTPLGSPSVFLEPTTVAAQHKSTITDHLYGYVDLQFAFVFPACCQTMLELMCARGARMHYVPDQDRPVVDPKSANVDSPDVGYGSVAAEYPREVMYAFLMARKVLPEGMEIGLSHGDHTKAFMKIALHWRYIGQFTFLFDGRFYVLRVTPFGFKWATHTFSPFPLAIQESTISSFQRHLMTCPELQFMTDSQRSFFAQCWQAIFNYCDDYLAMCPMIGALPEYLNHFLYVAGLKILGPGCWSLRKAAEDGFYASKQCFIGVVFDAVHDTVRVDVSMWQKLRVMLLTVSDTRESYELGFIQRIFGVLIWIIQVHNMWKPYLNGWLRMMKGVSTADASPSTLCYPGLDGEDPELARVKCYRDSLVLLQVADEVIATDGEFGAVSMEAFNGTIQPDSLKATSCSSDASLELVCVTWNCGRRMICERVPKSCVALLRLVLEKNGVTVTEQRLTIAIFEFMAIPMAQFQWGAEWKKLGILHVYFYIDNSNACVWLQKGFSSSPIAQDLCRIVAANEFAYGFVCTAVWTPTKVNLINDTRSRVLHDGKVDQEAVDLLEQLNAALDEPYFEEPMCDDAKGLMEHLEQMHSCYDVIALYKRASPVFSSVAPLAGPSMAQQLHDYRLCQVAV